MLFVDSARVNARQPIRASAPKLGARAEALAYSRCLTFNEKITVRNCTNRASQKIFSSWKISAPRCQAFEALNLCKHARVSSTLAAAVKARRGGKARRRGMSESDG